MGEIVRDGATGQAIVATTEGHSDLPFRELVVAPCRMVYLPRAGQVSIVTLEHSRQELTDDDLVLGSQEEDPTW